MCVREKEKEDKGRVLWHYYTFLFQTPNTKHTSLGIKPKPKSKTFLANTPIIFE